MLLLLLLFFFYKIENGLIKKKIENGVLDLQAKAIFLLQFEPT
jgi:hypothetical protein